MRATVYALLGGIVIAAVVYVIVRRRSRLSAPSTTTGPKRAHGGGWGALSPMQKMDTIQNFLRWRGEMSNLDRILEDIAPAAAATAAEPAKRRCPGTSLWEFQSDPEEERLIAAALLARNNVRDNAHRAPSSAPPEPSTSEPVASPYPDGTTHPRAESPEPTAR